VEETMEYAQYLTRERNLAQKVFACQVAARLTASPRALLAIALMAIVVTLLLMADNLSTSARITLAVFAIAVIGWTVLDLDETPVAIAAAIALVAFNVTAKITLYDALGNDLIWLMIGGFVLAAAVTQSGLAERIASRFTAGATSVNSLFHRVTWLIVATAFVVPSTSARAALLLPIFLGLARTIDRPRITRALALLFPTIILLSACASMLGAGAHLVALDFMRRVDGNAPDFIGWLLLATPFALASSYLAIKIVGYCFLTRSEREGTVALPLNDENQQMPMPSAQRNLAWVFGLTLIAWMSAGMHGIDAAMIALIGALAATTKALTGVDLKSAVKKVEWNLVLFLAGTLVLGEALQNSGAATALAQGIVGAIALDQWSDTVILGLCAIVALVSHLVITSRTVRATVLIPAFAIPLATHGIEPSLLIFVAVIGSGFCQTLTVSAKPVAVFAQTEQATFTKTDLMVLSAALLIPLLVLLMTFALWVWPSLGLGR
jgi:solute carrier family 13 (sodium-dependent dicarboxylate transporter), member 2/3/5